MSATADASGSASAGEVSPLPPSGKPEPRRPPDKPRASSASTPRSLPRPLDPKTLKAVRKIIALTDGRDKAMKFLQYSGKMLLWLWLHDKKRYPVSAPRLAALVSTLSTTRKMIRLAHVVEPAFDLADFLTGKTAPPAPGRPIKDHFMYRLAFFGAVVGVFNDLADDVYSLAKIGALDKSLVKPADKLANRLWLAGIVVDTVSTADYLISAEKRYRVFKRKVALQSDAVGDGCKSDRPEDATLDYLELRKLKDKRYWLRITLLKFIMDGIFCSWDVFNLTGSDGWQICCGWLSGVLSGYKLWHKTVTLC